MAQTPSNAPAINPAIDCSAAAGGCTIYRYGFGQPDSYTNGEPNPYDVLAKNHSSYSGSYFYSKNNPGTSTGECIAERGFVPVTGQVLIREEADCLPPVLGAGTCVGGTAPGAACTSGFDCPAGLCSNLDAGCPVEIASDLGVPGQDIFFGSGFVSVTATGFGPIWVSTAFNGSLVTDGPGLWLNPKRLGIGRRFQRPGGGTQVIWVDQLNGGGDNGVGENFSVLCCNDVAQGAICGSQAFQKYPTLTSLPERANEGRNEAPWLYPTDNPATPAVEGNWTLDEDFEVPGQVHGNCTIDRRVGCSRPSGPTALSNAQCTGPGAPHFCCVEAGIGYCGAECNVGGCTTRGCSLRVCSNAPNTTCMANSQCPGGTCLNPSCTSNGDCPAVTGQTNTCLAAPKVPCRLNSECPGSGTCAGITNVGTCDLRERGWRFNRLLSSLADGSPDPTKCNASPFMFRGFLNQFCSVVVMYNECLALDPPETCIVPSGKRVGRCTDSDPNDGFDATTVRCSEGPSPLPLTDNGNLRWGDPGSDCAIRNYGPQLRPDLDCDGIEDATIDTNADGIADQIGDACPYYSEANSIDVDPSPAVNTMNTDNQGRANECECGDSNRDGVVNVADIVDLNAKIFNPPGQGTPAVGNADLSAPLSDANEDGLFNVSDIVAVNIDIFSAAQASRCGRSPVIGE